MRLKVVVERSILDAKSLQRFESDSLYRDVARDNVIKDFATATRQLRDMQSCDSSYMYIARTFSEARKFLYGTEIGTLFQT